VVAELPPSLACTVYRPGWSRLGPPWFDLPFQVVINRSPLPASSVSGAALEPTDRAACQITVEPWLTVIPSVLGSGIRLAVDEPVLMIVSVRRTLLPLRYVDRFDVRVSAKGDAA
jgi:hypothetical protein